MKSNIEIGYYKVKFYNHDDILIMFFNGTSWERFKSDVFIHDEIEKYEKLSLKEPEPEPDNSAQMESLFNRWKSIGADVAQLGNIVQNPRSVPFPKDEIERFSEIATVTEKAFFRLLDDTLEFIEGEQ